MSRKEMEELRERVDRLETWARQDFEYAKAIDTVLVCYRNQWPEVDADNADIQGCGGSYCPYWDSDPCPYLEPPPIDPDDHPSHPDTSSVPEDNEVHTEVE